MKEITNLLTDWKEFQGKKLTLCGDKILVKLVGHQAKEIKHGSIIVKEQKDYDKAIVVAIGNRIADRYGNEIDITETIKIGTEVKIASSTSAEFPVEELDGTVGTYMFITYNDVVMAINE